jgi:hypothetical protein
MLATTWVPFGMPRVPAYFACLTGSALEHADTYPILGSVFSSIQLND